MIRFVAANGYLPTIECIEEPETEAGEPQEPQEPQETLSQEPQEPQEPLGRPGSQARSRKAAEDRARGADQQYVMVNR
jgi:hypothetical protein